MRQGRWTPLVAWLVPALLAALLGLSAAGCSLKYAEGQSLEQQGRWEEAMQDYRDAVIDYPSNPEYRAAWKRAEKVVARDNFRRYKDFLADKAFRKAYARLLAASRQDPTYAPVQAELPKWTRVLVGGQVHFRFNTAQANLTLAQKIQLVVRINTPNPGETITADVDIDNGTFFAEDLLYDKPNELLTLYSINSIGVKLTYGRSRIKQFVSTDYDRFINVRTPIVDNLSGTLDVNVNGPLTTVAAQRATLKPEVPAGERPQLQPGNPHYSLQITGDRIVVSTPRGAPRPDYTPRFLYINREDRRVFVDFGRYEVSLPGRNKRWELKRLPLAGQDYFPKLARNIALQPYFFYREGVFAFTPARSG